MMFNFIGIQDLATNLGIYLFVSMQSYMCVLMLDQGTPADRADGLCHLECARYVMGGNGPV